MSNLAVAGSPCDTKAAASIPVMEKGLTADKIALPVR